MHGSPLSWRSNLLSMPLPDMLLKLSPIFVLSKPKLVAATTDPDPTAAQFSTTELMKTKLHLVVGESIVNTDGENHHHGYDQLVKENITAESTDVYSIAHPFGADEANKHAWIRAFYEASKESGLTFAVEFTAETFFIRELDVAAVGEATTGVWDMDNCLCAANGSAKHTGLKVQPWDLQTTPQVNDRSGPAPSALAKMIDSNNLMSNIKRWSKQNAPNAAWAAAAASMAVDTMDVDTGSGSGGGAIEARFKPLEEENVKLRKEMGSISTAVTEIGTNLKAGFQQLMQGQQQEMAALLARIQGTDASVSLVGHAVVRHSGHGLCDAGSDCGGSYGLRRGRWYDCSRGRSRRSRGRSFQRGCRGGYGDGADSGRHFAGRPSFGWSAVPAGHNRGPAWRERTRGRTDGPRAQRRLGRRRAASWHGRLLVETRLQRLKRIARFSARLLAAPSASDGDERTERWERCGRRRTGRRSARLASTTETGDDDVFEAGGFTTDEMDVLKPNATGLHDCRWWRA